MRTRTAIVLALLVLAATGCSGPQVEEGDAVPTPAPTPAPTPTPTPTPIGEEQPASFRFVAPTTCGELLPSSRLEAFAADGLELLGGPGGVYGTEYFAEPTPEERVGGITCVWGDETRVQTTLTISAAPLDAATRARIVDDLVAQGLNEVQVGSAIGYGVAGDEVSAACVLNVIRTDSWISVLGAIGGEDNFMRATSLAEEVRSQVYLPD